MNPEQWFFWLLEIDPWWGYAILFAGALTEYLVPPFPGDTVTLLGAIMIGAADWSMAAVVAATSLGSLFGALLDYEVGRYLALSDKKTWLHRLVQHERVKPKIDTVLEKFTRYGAAFILVNRFLPAIRSVFFVAAGMAGLKRTPVLIYAAISAVVWNVLLIGAGALVGYNLEALLALSRQYSTVVWLLLGLVVVALVGRAIWRRKRRAGT